MGWIILRWLWCAQVLADCPSCQGRRRASGLWKDSNPDPLSPPPPATPTQSTGGVLQNLTLKKLSLSVMNHVLPSHPRIHPESGERLTFPSLRQGERFKNLERSIGAHNVLMLRDVRWSLYICCYGWGGSFALVLRNSQPAWSSTRIIHLERKCCLHPRVLFFPYSIV